MQRGYQHNLSFLVCEVGIGEFVAVFLDGVIEPFPVLLDFCFGIDPFTHKGVLDVWV